MISIQTNVASLVAQQNLNVNTNFQNQTIQQLTSGYRINSSGDDAAGLAVANQYRSDIAELTQGVLNANDGVSTLQIADGGMNNISLMLDRLNTLASQSSSAAFTGDRSTVNSEFQSLLTEINRQSQSIGLNANGVLNTNIAVFVGGGKTQGSNANSTANGTVTVNLTGSAVDTKTLGLSGMAATAGTADIGNGSSTHTVAQILANASNTDQAGNYSNLYFAGPGFSDSSAVKVSVNLAGVTDINSLVTAINSAITGAGGGTSQADSAFKTAGIVASVHTDSSGGQQLQFSSSSSAFQVSAGDVMANALMGNFASGSTGASLTSTVAGAVASTIGTISTPLTVKIGFTGAGSSAPVTLNLSSSDTTTALAITDLTTQIADNSALQAAGISLSGAAGGTLTFSSALGSTFNVQVTGDTANMLGFGAFVSNGTGAADYQTVTGVAYNAAATTGTANLQFSLDGAGSSANNVSINLNGGDATSGKAVGTVAGAVGIVSGDTLAFTSDTGAHTVTFSPGVTTVALAASQINAQSLSGTWGVAATVDNNGFLNITSTTLPKGNGSFVNVTGGGAASELGMLKYTSISTTAAYDPTHTSPANTGIVQFQFSLNGAAALAANNFTVDLQGGDAASGVATGAAVGVISDVITKTLSFSVDGGAVINYTFTSAAATTALAATEFNAASVANNWGVTAQGVTGNFTLTSNTKGPTSDVDVTGGTATGGAYLNLTAQHNYGTARSAASIATAVSGLLTSTNSGALAAAGITFNNAAGVLSFSSSGNAFSVSTTPSTGTGELGFGTSSAAITGAVAQTNTGLARSEASVIAELNNQFSENATLQKAGLVASDNGSGAININSTTSLNNTYFRMNLGASGALGNLGFGVAAGASFTGNTVSGSVANSVDSQGASNTTAINFNNIVYGNDNQAITVSANNAAGVQQNLTIMLQNNSTARTGESLDQTINYINTQLQQTNNTTLQQIVAVKENVSGVEKINFVSALNAFSVTAGSAVNGVNNGTDETVAATTLGTGSNVSVDTIAGALQAVNAIAAATTKLGSAQAGVGRGENQLNWAINLAQSQISNFSSAQSRIRDADVAAEASNLTKAQVLQQASIAAMAQANSAPQAVLALLRG